MSGFWDDADIIDVYTRAQAIEDGALVELPADMTREAGINFPVAVTAAVHAACVAMTPKAEQMGCDERGRAWDLLWMARCAMRRARGSQLTFTVLAVTNRRQPTEHTLKLVCGPGDNAEPVLTVMFPNED